jgi:hypothetical protein
MHIFWLETFRGRDHLTNPRLRKGEGGNKTDLKERGLCGHELDSYSSEKNRMARLGGYEPPGNESEGLRASEGAPCPCNFLHFTPNDSATGRKGHGVHILRADAIMGQREARNGKELLIQPTVNRL